MHVKRATSRLAILAWVAFNLGWSACSQAPVLPTQTPTVPGAVTPYRTRTTTTGVATASLPGRTATPLPSPTPTPITHRVIQGETMLGLALQYGISLEELMAANPEVDPRFLSIDTDLVIPLGEGSPPVFVMPTPVPVNLGKLSCFTTGDRGAWCFWPVENDRSRHLENLSPRIRLYSTGGEFLAEALAIPPLNLVPGDQSLPLVAYFPPTLPEEIIPQGELLTAIIVSRNDERYLDADLQIDEVALSQSGLQATLNGRVSLPENSDPANLIWLAVVAYGEDGRVVGVRKWEAVFPQSGLPSPTQGAITETPVPGSTQEPLRGGAGQTSESGPDQPLKRPVEGGESLPFEIQVFSLGPPIQEVEVLVEARP